MDTISILTNDLVNQTFQERTTIVVEDVCYNDDTDKNVIAVVDPSHTTDDILHIIEVRKTLSTKTVRSDREKKSLSNAIASLDKISNYEGLVKKIKTLMKFSSDIDFPYLEVAEKIKNMDFYEDYHFSGETLNDELLQKLITSQVVYSLEHYSIIHPKIKLLVNLIGKLDNIDTSSEDGSMEFTL